MNFILCLQLSHLNCFLTSDGSYIDIVFSPSIEFKQSVNDASIGHSIIPFSCFIFQILTYIDFHKTRDLNSQIHFLTLSLLTREISFIMTTMDML